MREPELREGPVEIELADGTVARSDRFVVAVCTCRRSRCYPWCDTSHRRRSRSSPPAPGGSGRPAGGQRDEERDRPQRGGDDGPRDRERTSGVERDAD